MALRTICAFSLLNVFFLVLTITSGLTVDRDTTQESAEKIGKELEKVMKKVTKFDNMQKKYVKNDFTVKERDGVQMVKDMKEKLEGILQKKIQSILSLADEAESLMKNYTWNEDLTLDELLVDPVIFLDSKFLESSRVKVVLEEEVSFSNTIKVNMTYSTVHVPTDVYNGSQIIVNSVKYTKDLDKTFIKNRERDPSLLWQYFGTSTGIYRVYPGYKWRYENNQDFFDHRRRGWYIQGSSSPKDMVILLDLSGSMVGNKLAISKLSASLLLDTLQENDFVNIVTFNDVSRMLCEEDFDKTTPEVKQEFKKGCSKKLLQATKQNIKYLKDMVNLVKASEAANVSSGFRLALEVLELAKKNQSGTECIQTINFFSDGVEQNEYEKSLEVLEKGKAKERQIRVFGYLVGREKNSPFLPIRNIACKYRGYFYTIETLSDVRENVTSYLNVLSRPLALQRYQSNTPTWTPLYMDKLGLGLMVTVVAPVYDPNQKDKLLGVVGTDVALPELKSSIPAAKVGVDGYGFSINNNGFIVIHPTLKDDENPPHLSLEDVNVEESRLDLENLSKRLIDRETGEMSFKMRVLSKDKKRVSAKRSYNFFYNDIAGTSFSAGIAMTNRGRKYFETDRNKFASGQTFKQVLDLLKPQHTNETVMLSPWDICPGITPKKRASTPLYKPVYADADDMLTNLTDDSEAQKLCNAVEFNQLLYGAFATSDLNWDLEVNDTNGYLSVFVGTNGGLSRVLSPGSDNPISNDVTNEQFYQRASDFNQNQTGSVVVFTNHKGKDSKSRADSIITASIPIIVNEVLAGVAGMQMKDDTLQEILLNNSEVCKKENDSYSCYLLDEDGFVVASTSSESKVEVGKRFDAVHYSAFNQMVNDGLYEVVVYNDSNYKCSKQLGVTGSNAMRLINPLLAVSSYVTWMTQTLFWSLVQFNVFSFFSRKSQVFAADESTDKNYCTANIKYYKATVMNIPYTKKDDCKDNCLGEFFVASVFKSNLRLVIQKKCGCEAKKQKEWNKKLEVESSFITPTSHYRKLPQLKCYAYSDKESKECGSGCSLSPIKLLIIGLTLVYSLLAH